MKKTNVKIGFVPPVPGQDKARAKFIVENNSLMYKNALSKKPLNKKLDLFDFESKFFSDPLLCKDFINSCEQKLTVNGYEDANICAVDLNLINQPENDKNKIIVNPDDDDDDPPEVKAAISKELEDVINALKDWDLENIDFKKLAPKDFLYIDLKKVDLNGVDLMGVDLSFACLTGVNLTKCKIDPAFRDGTYLYTSGPGRNVVIRRDASLENPLYLIYSLYKKNEKNEGACRPKIKQKESKNLSKNNENDSLLIMHEQIKLRDEQTFLKKQNEEKEKQKEEEKEKINKQKIKIKVGKEEKKHS